MLLLEPIKRDLAATTKQYEPTAATKQRTQQADIRITLGKRGPEPDPSDHGDGGDDVAEPDTAFGEGPVDRHREDAVGNGEEEEVEGH